MVIVNSVGDIGGMTDEALIVQLSASFDWSYFAARPEDVVKARLDVAKRIIAARKSLQRRQQEVDDWQHEQEQEYLRRSGEISMAHHDLWIQCPHWVIDEEGICELCGAYV